MIFSKTDIVKAIEDKEIVITPFSEESIRQASVELSLGNDIFYIPKDGISIDILKPETASNLKLISYTDNETINVNPGDFIIATTKEAVNISGGIVARVEGESVLRSLGLIIYSREEHLEPGSTGIISFGIKNVGVKTIIIKPGMKICRLVFEQLLTPVEVVKVAKAKESNGNKKE